MKRIASVMTKSTFMHIESALDIQKIRFFVGTYTKGQGMHEHIVHYMDADDALILALDLFQGAEINYVEFKGSRNGAGEVRARIMKVESAYAKDHGTKYFFEFTEGPGMPTATGAIKMAGADTKITVALNAHIARRIGARLYAYLLQNAHFGEEQWEKGEGEGAKGKASDNGQGMKDPDAPATEKQWAYIERLLDELNVPPEHTDGFLRSLGYDQDTLTKAEASDLIDELKALKEEEGAGDEDEAEEEPKPRKKGGNGKPKGEVQGDDKTKFYKVLSQAVKGGRIAPETANEFIQRGKQEGWEVALAELLAVLPD